MIQVPSFRKRCGVLKKRHNLQFRNALGHGENFLWLLLVSYKERHSARTNTRQHLGDSHDHRALGGAVGTIAAVLVALFYPILHSRSHLSVQVVTSGSYKPDTPVHVLLDNTGGKSITALRVMTDSKGKLYEAGDSKLLPRPWLWGVHHLELRFCVEAP